MSTLNLLHISEGPLYRRLRLSGLLAKRSFSTIVNSSTAAAVSKSSWWYRYVYGVNPACPNQAKVANLLAKDDVNPLLMERNDLEEFKKLWLQEQVSWNITDEEKAWSNVKEKYRRRFEIVKREVSLMNG